MKRRTKKLFSLLLSLALVVGMIPVFGVMAYAVEKLDTPAIQLNDKNINWRPVENAQQYEITLLYKLGGAGEAVSIRAYVGVDSDGSVMNANAYLANSSTPIDVKDRTQYIPSLNMYILNLDGLVSFYHAADYRGEIRATASDYTPSDTVSTDKITGQSLTDGYATLFTLAGKVTFSSDSGKYSPGSTLTAVCTGSTFDEVSTEELQYVWQYRDGESGSASNIPGASGKTYAIEDQYDGKQISVAVTSTKRSGIVYSGWISVNDSSSTEAFSVKVVNDGNGTASATPISGPDGTVVTLTATPNPGYKFKEWVRTAGKLSGGLDVPNATSATTSFTISGYNVEVMATFEEDGSDQPVDVTNYTVTVINDGKGTGSASPASGPNGTVVTITATPNPGYKFKEWVRIAGKLSGGLDVPNATSATTSFTISGYNVEVKATFEKSSSGDSNPFVDVTETDYFYEPVLWAVGKGITNGTDATHFSPGATCTRGQVVTFLWRAAGSPSPSSSTNPFTDVNSSDYYYNAVLWAVGKNITKGTSPTTFGPNDGCTRGQVVTFLHRFENTPTPASSTNPFVDVSSSEYYYTPVLWAVGKGITNGTDATHFSPNDTCTRGQIVTFLYRDMK